MLQRLPTYLTLNRFGIYYFQYRVPEYQQSLRGGQKLIRKSLRTRDRRLALQLAQRWFQRMSDKEIFDYEHKITSEADLYSKGRSVHTEYDQIDPNDINAKDEFFMRLSEFEVEALKHYSKITAAQQAVQAIPATVQPQPITEEEANSPRLKDVIESYITEKKHGWRDHAAVKTERTIRIQLGLFYDVLGNVPVSKLDKSDISRFKDTLMKLPANRKKVRLYKHKTLEELRQMKIPERHRLGSTTIKDYSNRAIGFLEWCADNDYADSNISAPLRAAKKSLKKSKRSQDQRDIFSDSDLNKLFLSEPYLQSSHKRPSQHWIPLLALFTGARLGELSQLYVEDIKHDKKLDIWYMDINDEGDKGVKSDSSNRVVPIHKQLIKLGFIDYVRSIKRKRLFDEIKRSTDGNYEAMSRWFNVTYRKNCDVGQKFNEKKTFHSFRHTFLNAFKQQGLSMDLAEEMAGHAPSGSETRIRYAKSSNLELKNQTLQKLKYSGVDFSKIRCWKDAVKLNSKR